MVILMRAVAAGMTDRGQQHEENEDAFLVLEDRGIFVVADGMKADGGSSSALIVETLGTVFHEDGDPLEAFDPNFSDRESRLLWALRLANDTLHERRQTSREWRTAGATVVAAAFDPQQRRMSIANVGDARGYRLRGGKLQQLTIDHAPLVHDIFDVNGLTDTEIAKTFGPPPDVRAIGLGNTVRIDLQRDEARVGDTYLLCTDGLTGMVPEEGIRRSIVGANDLGEACRRLVDEANALGGEDNIAVILVQMTDR